MCQTLSTLRSKFLIKGVLRTPTYSGIEVSILTNKCTKGDICYEGNLLRLVRFTGAKIQKILHIAITLRLIIKSLTF